MSLLPMLFSDWWEDLDRPHHLADQHFGLDLSPELLCPAMYVSRDRRHPLAYYRPRIGMPRKGESGFSTVEADKDKFQVVLDVQQFQPEEIDVKVVDKCVVVTAKHEEKQDEHGWISRQFTRKYLIPEQCEVDQVASKLSSDGVLTIIAPRKHQPKLENERQIKIEHTGKPAIQGKPTSKKQQQSVKDAEEKPEKK